MEVVFDKLRLLSGRGPAEGIVGRAMVSHPGTQELEVEMRRGVWFLITLQEINISHLGKGKIIF